MPENTKENATAGPAFSPAASPVSTKIPVPMITPTPKTVSCKGPSSFRSWCSDSSVSAIDCSIVFVRVRFMLVSLPSLPRMGPSRTTRRHFAEECPAPLVPKRQDPDSGPQPPPETARGHPLAAVRRHPRVEPVGRGRPLPCLDPEPTPQRAPSGVDTGRGAGSPLRDPPAARCTGSGADLVPLEQESASGPARRRLLLRPDPDPARRGAVARVDAPRGAAGVRPASGAVPRVPLGAPAVHRVPQAPAGALVPGEGPTGQVAGHHRLWDRL